MAERAAKRATSGPRAPRVMPSRVVARVCRAIGFGVARPGAATVVDPIPRRRGAIGIDPIARARSAVTIALVACALAACSHTVPFAVRPSPGTAPALDAVEHRLVLIGDSGDPDPAGEPVLDVLQRRASLIPGRTTVVFLGDVVYETGMPEATAIEGTPVEEILDEALLNMFESRQEAEQRVKMQVKAVDLPGVHAIFIPGNHDWDQFGVGGWASVRRLGDHLAQVRHLAHARVDFLPGGGCPGPSTVDLGRRARLVVLDTQWFLEVGARPSPDDNPTGCPYTTEADVLAAFGRELRAAHAAGRAAVVVGHHPLRSRGPHGGYLGPVVHLFPMTMLSSYVPFFVRWLPLPVLGTAMALAREWMSPSPQDFSSPPNRDLRRALLDTMQDAADDGAAPLVYAAGHEHSLQVFRSERGPRYTIVSGLGSSSKASHVRHDRTSLFAHANREHAGFVELEFLRDGRVRLGVVEADPATRDGAEVYAHVLDAGAGRTRTAAGERAH